MSEILPDKKVSLADTISAANTEAERRNDAKAPEKIPEITPKKTLADTIADAKERASTQDDDRTKEITEREPKR